MPARVPLLAATPGESGETRKSLAGRVRSREAQIGGEDGLAARWAEVIRRRDSDVTLGVDLLEAVILGEGLVERIGVLARASGPLAHQAQVGGHHLEGEHQGRLDEAHHATEAASDVLGARVAQVAEDALDVSAGRTRPATRGCPSSRAGRA